MDFQQIIGLILAVVGAFLLGYKVCQRQSEKKDVELFIATVLHQINNEQEQLQKQLNNYLRQIELLEQENKLLKIKSERLENELNNVLRKND